MKVMNFQQKTADRILEIFSDPNRTGQKRVLLSDEVGLGKTIMAREVIDRVRELQRQKNDDYYRIVYVCSNQNIIQRLASCCSVLIIVCFNTCRFEQ